MGGFGFVVIFFFVFGVNEFLMMIWGEVENILLRVEGLEIFYVDRILGLVFKILELGCREWLGLKMVNEVVVKNWVKK